jgi:GNAT superfamily N-acetyltransferase
MDVALYGEADYAETVDLLTESFCAADPVEAALSITHDEFRAMIRLELDAVPPNDLSVVMRDPATARLIAVTIVTDGAAEPVDSCAPVSPKFAPISEIARSCHDRYFATRTVEPGSHAYVFAAAVHPERLGQGLGVRIVHAALENARARGYRAAFSMTTNRASARIVEGLGFKAIDSVSYQDYRYEGRAVFASITGHPGIVLWEHPDLTQPARPAVSQDIATRMRSRDAMNTQRS